MKIESFEMSLRLQRDDSIPALGAFLRCEAQHDESPVILVNVQALMVPEMEDETGNAVPMPREERKRVVIETLMHEFGHALESFFRLPVDEEAIEKACMDWKSAYGLAKAEGRLLPPSHGVVSAYRDSTGWVLYDAEQRVVETWPEGWEDAVTRDFLIAHGVEIVGL